MSKITLSTPQFGFIVATRAALAFGLGLLASSRFDDPRRRALGRTLAVVGALATIPAVLFIRRGRERSRR